MKDTELIVELRKRAKVERGKAHRARELAAYYKVPAQDQSRVNDIRNGHLADADIADSQARFYTRCANIVGEYLNMGNEK